MFVCFLCTNAFKIFYWTKIVHTFFYYVTPTAATQGIIKELESGVWSVSLTVIKSKSISNHLTLPSLSQHLPHHHTGTDKHWHSVPVLNPKSEQNHQISTVMSSSILRDSDKEKQTVGQNREENEEIVYERDAISLLSWLLERQVWHLLENNFCATY